MGTDIPFNHEVSELTTEIAKLYREEFVPATGTPEMIIVEGPCPACEHSTRYTHREKPYQAYGGDIAAGPEYNVTVICQCGLAHSGRPEDEKLKGCGRYWSVVVTRPQPPIEGAENHAY